MIRANMRILRVVIEKAMAKIKNIGKTITQEMEVENTKETDKKLRTRQLGAKTNVVDRGILPDCKETIHPGMNTRMMRNMQEHCTGRMRRSQEKMTKFTKHAW